MFERVNFEKISESQNLDKILGLEKKFKRPNPDNFLDIYSSEEINKDKEHAILIEKRIEEKKKKMTPEEREIYEMNNKRGEALEVILDFLINEHGWLGYGYSTRTSRIDDLISGVDAVVEYKEDQIERIALAVDASTSSDLNDIEEKIFRNLRDLKNNSNGASIKYFKSQISDKNNEYFRGKLKNLIPVVAGADKKNANDLFDKFSQLMMLEKRNDESQKEKIRNLKLEICRNPVHGIILDGIKIQLEMYLNVLDENKIETRNQINKLIGIIDEAIENSDSSYDFIQDNTLDNIKIISKNTVNLIKGGFK